MSMFPKTEAKWNAHTPTYLHNGTKENLVFQLIMLVAWLLGYSAWTWWDERRFRNSAKNINKNLTTE